MEQTGPSGVNVDTNLVKGWPRNRPRRETMKKIIVAVASLLALAACAAAPNPNVAAARTICAGAYADPALDPIRARIPFDDDVAAKASMEYLADPGKPNSFERSVLQQYDAANRRCWDAWDRVGTSPFVQQSRTSVSAALAELHGGNATYGEFNRRRASAIADMQARLREAEERARAQYRGSGVMFCDGWGRGPFTTLHCF